MNFLFCHRTLFEAALPRVVDKSHLKMTRRSVLPFGRMEKSGWGGAMQAKHSRWFRMGTAWVDHGPLQRRHSQFQGQLPRSDDSGRDLRLRPTLFQKDKSARFERF